MNLTINLLFSFFSPLYNIIRKKSDKEKFFSLVLFTTIAGSILPLREGNDGLVYSRRVEEYYSIMGFDKFITQFTEIIRFNETEIGVSDPYIHLVSYFSGGILHLPITFWIIVSLVYGYFYIGTILLLKTYNIKQQSYFLLFFFILIILTKSIDGINTVRTWSGFWFFFYFNLKYAITQKNKYFYISLLCPFFHIMYFSIIIPALFSFFIYKKNYLVLFILSLSIIFKSTNISSVYNNIGVEFSSLTQKANLYNIKNTQLVFEEVIKTNRWYLSTFSLGLQNYVIIILYVFIVLKSKHIKSEQYPSYYILNTGALIMALSNFSGNNLSLSGRSGIIAFAFMLSGIYMLLSKENKFKNNFILTIASVFLIPYLIYRLADIYYMVSIWLLIFPFIALIEPDINASVESIVAFFLK